MLQTGFETRLILRQSDILSQSYHPETKENFNVYIYFRICFRGAQFMRRVCIYEYVVAGDSPLECSTHGKGSILALLWRGQHGLVANLPDYDIVISEIKILSRNYSHFRTNTLRKVMNLLKPHPPSYGLDSYATLLL